MTPTANSQPQGTCAACGESNAYTRWHCYECGARLPWADALEAARQGAIAPAPSVTNGSPAGAGASHRQSLMPSVTPLVGQVAVAGTVPGDTATFMQAPHPSSGAPVLVRVTARLLDWPYACACCGQSLEGAAAVGHKVLRLSAQIGQVPYCAACARHVEVAGGGDNTFGCCLLLAVFGLLPFFLLFQSLADSTSFGILGAIVSSLALALAGYQAREGKLREARQSLNTGCCGLHHAVTLKDSHDSEHSFLFKRPEYAAAFMQANRHKVTPHRAAPAHPLSWLRL